MARDVVFVLDRGGYQRAFKSWYGSPLGGWMTKKTEETKLAARAEAPGPGKPIRNRSGVSYATGRLETQIISTKRVDGSGDLEGHVVALPYYATFVHGGTRPHVIVPKSPTGMLRWTRFGVSHFAREVNHPGQLANPFLVRALEAAFR